MNELIIRNKDKNKILLIKKSFDEDITLMRVTLSDNDEISDDGNCVLNNDLSDLLSCEFATIKKYELYDLINSFVENRDKDQYENSYRKEVVNE